MKMRDEVLSCCNGTIICMCLRLIYVNISSARLFCDIKDITKVCHEVVGLRIGETGSIMSL